MFLALKVVLSFEGLSLQRLEIVRTSEIGDLYPEGIKDQVFCCSWVKKSSIFMPVQESMVKFPFLLVLRRQGKCGGICICLEI